MFNIRLLAVLPFLAITTGAYAGATISDARYWPGLAHPNAPLNSFAQAGKPAALNESGEDRTTATQVWIYRGGPKTGIRSGG